MSSDVKNMFDKEKLNQDLAEKLRKAHPLQLITLIRMHLSFTLDLSFLNEEYDKFVLLLIKMHFIHTNLFFLFTKAMNRKHQIRQKLRKIGCFTRKRLLFVHHKASRLKFQYSQQK